MKIFKILVISTLFFFLTSCGSGYILSSIHDIIENNDGTTGGLEEGIITEGGIDTDGDGTVDIPTDPIDDPDDDQIRDPDTGDCIVPASTMYYKITENRSFTASDLKGQKNLFIHLSSNSIDINVDLGGTSLSRIIVRHSGGSNDVTVKNVQMTQGFCNEALSGNTNTELLEASCSAPIVDEMAAGGNNNNLDMLFIPTVGFKYLVGGNDNCMSAPQGTNILDGSQVDGSGNTVLLDGTTCR